MSKNNTKELFDRSRSLYEEIERTELEIEGLQEKLRILKKRYVEADKQAWQSVTEAVADRD